MILYVSYSCAEPTGERYIDIGLLWGMLCTAEIMFNVTHTYLVKYTSSKL